MLILCNLDEFEFEIKHEDDLWILYIRMGNRTQLAQSFQTEKDALMEIYKLGAHQEDLKKLTNQ